MDTQALLNKFFRSKNIMTPDILRYGVCCGHAYEMSYGAGIMRGKLFGVTVLSPGEGAPGYTKGSKS